MLVRDMQVNCGQKERGKAKEMLGICYIIILVQIGSYESFEVRFGRYSVAKVITWFQSQWPPIRYCNIPFLDLGIVVFCILNDFGQRGRCGSTGHLKRCCTFRGLD
jgi:hypothetical protein